MTDEELEKLAEKINVFLRMYTSIPNDVDQLKSIIYMPVFRKDGKEMSLGEKIVNYFTFCYGPEMNRYLLTLEELKETL